MGKAMEMYTSDYDEYYVPGEFDMQLTINFDPFVAGHWRWHGWRKEWDLPFDPRIGYLASYLGYETLRLPRTPEELDAYEPLEAGELEKLQGIKMCPSFRSAYETRIDAATNAFERGAGGYGYNALYLGGSTARFPNTWGFDPAADARIYETPARKPQVRRPDETVMFTETAMAQQDGNRLWFIEQSNVLPPRYIMDGNNGKGVELPEWGISVATTHFRHEGLANVLWCDHHVSVRRVQFTNGGWSAPYPSSQQQAENDIGFFGGDTNALFDYE
jgi:prepilin-type processing-associated H-X9-DG protein